MDGPSQSMVVTNFPHRFVWSWCRREDISAKFEKLNYQPYVKWKYSERSYAEVVLTKFHQRFQLYDLN